LKIAAVSVNPRKKMFEVRTRKIDLLFPFSLGEPAPTSDDPVVEVFVDKELGREAFTYLLKSGAEGTVHVDSVLEYNEDPSYLAELSLYELSSEIARRFRKSGISVREICRLLDTSPTQLYRLLDPSNQTKSAKQLIALAFTLGCDLALRPKNSPMRSHSRAPTIA